MNWVNYKRVKRTSIVPGMNADNKQVKLLSSLIIKRKTSNRFILTIQGTVKGSSDSATHEKMVVAPTAARRLGIAGFLHWYQLKFQFLKGRQGSLPDCFLNNAW